SHSGYEKFPDGDRIEMFFAGEKAKSGVYYQLVFNAAGWRYEGKGLNKSWNGKWSVKTRIGKNGWQAVAVVPLKTIQASGQPGSKIKALFYRRITAAGDGQSEHSSWGGGKVHVLADFGMLNLE